MDSQKKFLLAAADMEQALADALQAVVERDDFSPDQLERMLRLITKKEIILSFLLEEMEHLHAKPKKRKKTFKNTNPIWIPAEGVTGPANPYPSVIQVSGVKGVVKKVTVTLHHIYHTWPRDIQVMLVGPDGKNIVLMTFIGAGTTFDNLTLTFDDDATSQLPPFGAVASGTYQPTARSRMTFPAPAPLPSTNTHLSIFKGINPNGQWLLYVQDIFDNDTGVIAGGWELTIITEDPRTKKTYTNSFIEGNAMLEEPAEPFPDETLYALEETKQEWKHEETIEPKMKPRKHPRSNAGQVDEPFHGFDD